jgi:preprotein translocase subunit SecD
VFFYRWLGAVALSALAVFGVLLAGIIAGLSALVGFALTLAGAAGIIVAIGITADSSILFFERIREEVNLGKTSRTAVRKAFTSAFRTNLTGNTVTLTAATILYFLAVGPVRGFALMLGIATLLDLLILAFFTRPVVELMGGTKLLSRRNLRAVEAPVPAKGMVGAGSRAAGGAR